MRLPARGLVTVGYYCWIVSVMFALSAAASHRVNEVRQPAQRRGAARCASASGCRQHRGERNQPEHGSPERESPEHGSPEHGSPERGSPGTGLRLRSVPIYGVLAGDSRPNELDSVAEDRALCPALGQRASGPAISRAQVAARSSSNSRSRVFCVRRAARSNSAPASRARPSLARRSPRTVGNR